MWSSIFWCFMRYQNEPLGALARGTEKVTGPTGREYCSMQIHLLRCDSSVNLNTFTTSVGNFHTLTEILFSQARLFPHPGDPRALECLTQVLQRLERPLVRRDVKIDLPVLRSILLDHLPDPPPALPGLDLAQLGEPNLGVWDSRVGALVHVPFALPMPNQNDSTRPGRRHDASWDQEVVRQISRLTVGRGCRPGIWFLRIRAALNGIKRSRNTAWDGKWISWRQFEMRGSHLVQVGSGSASAEQQWLLSVALSSATSTPGGTYIGQCSWMKT